VLPVFIEFVETEWIPNLAYGYFKSRGAIALNYLPKFWYQKHPEIRLSIYCGDTTNGRISALPPHIGRVGALRRPRRVERCNRILDGIG
jgi:hypothetical protein